MRVIAREDTKCRVGTKVRFDLRVKFDFITFARDKLLANPVIAVIIYNSATMFRVYLCRKR